MDLTLSLTLDVRSFLIDLAAEIYDATVDDDLRHSRVTERNDDERKYEREKWLAAAAFAAVKSTTTTVELLPT